MYSEFPSQHYFYGNKNMLWQGHVANIFNGGLMQTFLKENGG